MTEQRPEIGFIWKITDDVLRDVFRKNEIGDVMLPFVVIRRIDCLLGTSNDKVREAFLKFKDKVDFEKLEPILKKEAGGKQFFNTSQHTLKSLTEDSKNIEINFSSYLNGFNKEVREILDYFQFDKVVARLVKNKLLYQMISAICEIDLSFEKVDSHNMGYIFEELIRISNEQSNQTAGEHFTPRDVIQLVTAIVFSTEKEILNKKGIIRTIYDPACGTGGMLTTPKRYILEKLCDKNIPTINMFGQEINEQSYAIAKSDFLVTGEPADNIRHGNSFSEDRFPGKHFHYMMANPPYGVTWKKDSAFINNEALNPAGRFYAGLPRESDGQLLFLQHMISKIEPEGSRICMVTNGSPLFTGDAGSGESQIRKWIISNDWLDCIIALPKDLFYNTGISTYLWFVTNKKEAHRKGKVQLINAIDLCKPEKRNINNKRNRFDEENIQKILDIYSKFENEERCKIFDNEFFGYYQVTVEQSLIENGKPVLDKKGNPKPDSKKRDTENIPFNEDIELYFEREVIPHVPDAWIDYDRTRIGYEINFSKYFYEYSGVRSSQNVKSEIINLENKINMLLSKFFEL